MSNLMHVQRKICCLLTLQRCLFGSPVALLSISHQRNLKVLKYMHLFLKLKQKNVCRVNKKSER